MKKIFLVIVAVIAYQFTPAQSWMQVSSGTDAPVNALMVYNNELIIGGDFTSPFKGIAKWDTSNFIPFGLGVDTSVNCFDTLNGNLYAGGNFAIMDTVVANNVAMWNGFSWSALGSGTNGPVYCMEFYQGELYVGGKFTLAGGSPAVNIAKWNGSTWSAVGNGLSNNNNFCSERVSALMVYGNALYAGGCFTSEGNNIAKWDGNAWSALGTGTDAPVDALQSFNNYLYVGGGFTNVNSSLCQYLAKWNGNWTNANTNINMSPTAFKIIGNKLFAAGFGFPNSSFFKLNGNTWNVVASGIPSAAFSPAHGIYTIDFFSHHLYLGGLFKLANNEYGDHLIYTSDTFLGVEDEESENAFSLFPNPSSGNFTLNIVKEVYAERRLEIMNALGEKVYAAPIPHERTSFDVQGLTKGIYLVRIISAKGANARKLVIE